ncbi:MAG TPA: hypothetical protein DCO72_04280 [Ruminococcus sp.]|nr:hypothetical protein [Ruminococcus sp.]
MKIQKIMLLSAFSLAMCLTACGVQTEATETAEVAPAQTVTLSNREDAKKFVAENSAFKGFSSQFVKAVQGETTDEIWKNDIESSPVPLPEDGNVEVKEPYRVAFVTVMDEGIQIEGEENYIVPICKNNVMVANVTISIEEADVSGGGIDYPNSMNSAVQEHDTFALFHYFPEDGGAMLYCGITPEDEIFVINQDNTDVSELNLPDVHFADFTDEYVMHSLYGETLLTEADYT